LLIFVFGKVTQKIPCPNWPVRASAPSPRPDGRGRRLNCAHVLVASPVRNLTVLCMVWSTAQMMIRLRHKIFGLVDLRAGEWVSFVLLFLTLRRSKSSHGK
jgi:hypothetical protein